MIEKRRHQRIDCAEKCLLCIAESKYYGAVMNISISGALVNLPDFIPSGAKPGDSCSIILNNDPDTSIFRHTGRIARINSSGIGLEILEHRF